MTNAPKIEQLPRPNKAAIALGLQALLLARQQSGPAEPALDAFIGELGDLGKALTLHVTGNVTADAARELRMAKLEIADDEVDACYRHLHGYLSVEALRRTGPHRLTARALLDAAFPEGLARVDDHIADENRYCRDALAVLAAPEHAAEIAALGLPTAWIAGFGAALDASDAALAEVDLARKARKGHVASGLDAEADWVDTMVRLRRYVGSRARRGDTARAEEGRALLAPLLDAMKKLRADATARATRKENEKKAAAKAVPPPASPATPGTPGPVIGSAAPLPPGPTQPAPSNGAPSNPPPAG